MATDPGRESVIEGSIPNHEEIEALFAIDIDLRRWWTVIPEIVALACAGLLPVLVALNVVARYTDWYQAPWINDVVSILFQWIVFLGGALAVKYRNHVKVTLISDRISKTRAGRIWDLLIGASPLLLGLILLVLGVQIVDLHMKRELVWLEIPTGYFSTVIPISGALILYYTARQLWERRTPARTDSGSGA